MITIKIMTKITNKWTLTMLSNFIIRLLYGNKKNLFIVYCLLQLYRKGEWK